MYYELFDELKQSSENKSVISWRALVNKSLIDNFYDVRSQIYPIYNDHNDLKRLVGDNYNYLFYQKIMNGIAKGVFLGVKPGPWMQDMFLPSGRIKVSEHNLEFYLEKPCLYFENSTTTFSFETSNLKIWEDELMKISPVLNKQLGITISREGFKANLYRILELTIGMRSISKKRSSWVEFLHEIIIHNKKFSLQEIALKNDIHQSDYLRISDKTFESHHYLEFIFFRSLGTISSNDFVEKELMQESPLQNFSILNNEILGRIPICHFYLTEHMFVGKEEFSLNQYFEYFVSSWTKSSQIEIFYLENLTNNKKVLSIGDFAKELKIQKYAIVLGFECDGVFYSAEPKMVKD